MVPEAVNGVEKLDNKLALPNMIYHTDTGQAGLISIRGSKNCITSVTGNAGGGITTITKAPSGLGDGKSIPSGGRGTKSFTTQTGDTSRPTITAVGNPDGTGITIDSGAGRAPTMQFATADGACSITMTSANGGAIILRAGNTELVINGKKGQVEVTKQVIQEKPPVKEQTEKYRKDMRDSLRNAMKPYSDSCSDCGGDGQTSEGSCSGCSGTGVSGSTGSSGSTSGTTTGSDFTGSGTSGVG